MGVGRIKADGRSFRSEIGRSPPGNCAKAFDRLHRHKPAAPLGTKLLRKLCNRFGQIGSAQSRCPLGLTLQAAAGYPRSIRDPWQVWIPLPCSSQWTALPCYQVPDRLGGSARKTKKSGVYRTKSDRVGTGWSLQTFYSDRIRHPRRACLPTQTGWRSLERQSASPLHGPHLRA